MDSSIISIGHDNFIPSNKILLILSRKTRAIKPIISKAELNHRLIDATNGRKTRTVIITMDNYVVLSSIAPKSIAERYAEEEGKSIMHIGSENFIPNQAVIAILQKDSEPIRELLKLARAQEKVIKATMGKATRSIVSINSGYFILCNFEPVTLAGRYKK